MNDKEWLKCEDLGRMFRNIDGEAAGRDSNSGMASKRKMRLFAVACCRHVWDWIKHKPSRKAVEASEAYADGLISEKELMQARLAALKPARLAALKAGGSFLPTAAADVAQPNLAVRDLAKIIKDSIWKASDENWAHGANLLRDIFGNPFRPITLNPSWLTSTVLALADGIYAEKAFDRMPILADALQDAGCDNEDVLNHCRQPGEHVRGCWVVDLLLDKS